MVIRPKLYLENSVISMYYSDDDPYKRDLTRLFWREVLSLMKSKQQMSLILKEGWRICSEGLRFWKLLRRDSNYRMFICLTGVYRRWTPAILLLQALETGISYLPLESQASLQAWKRGNGA